MATYITKRFERLDRIVYDYYGDTEDGIVEFVLSKNPGLEKHSILLPIGIDIELPARPVQPKTRTLEVITLWDF